jgi:hypothetical protein
MGAPDMPVRPISMRWRPRRRFAARAIDVDVKNLEYVLERAAKHTGTAFVEIYQNCNIFNDGAFDYATDKNTKADTTLYLEHGKPLVFAGGKKGIRLHDMTPGRRGHHRGRTRTTCSIHDEKAAGTRASRSCSAACATRTSPNRWASSATSSRNATSTSSADRSPRPRKRAAAIFRRCSRE